MLNTPRDRRILVALGDSIVEGKSAARHRGWLALVSAAFRTAGSSLRVENRALGGATIRDIHKTLYRDCLARNPEFVVLGTGVNDSRWRPSQRRTETPIPEFQRLLQSTVDSILSETNAMLLVVGQVPVVDSRVQPYKPDKVYRRSVQLRYERVLREVAQQRRVYFLDHFARWVALGPAFIHTHTFDGLHPNDVGHRDLAAYFLAYAKVHIPSLLRRS